MRQVYQTCNVCEGKGYVEHQDPKRGLTADGIYTHSSVCPKCQGGGYLDTDYFIEDHPCDELGLEYNTPLKGSNHA